MTALRTPIRIAMAGILAIALFTAGNTFVTALSNATDTASLWPVVTSLCLLFLTFSALAALLFEKSHRIYLWFAWGFMALYALTLTAESFIVPALNPPVEESQPLSQ